MHREKGFTLIEVLLSIVFVGIIMTGAVLLASSAFMMRSELRASVILEENVRFALGRIHALVEQSSAITSPAISTTGTILTLTMPTPAENPTTISFAGGSLVLTQGSGTPMALVSNEINMTNATFIRASSTTPTVRIILTAGLRDAAASFPSITVTTTASIRR